jgi:ABC-type phosphate transport system substrate-binding protein
MEIMGIVGARPAVFPEFPPTHKEQAMKRAAHARWDGNETSRKKKKVRNVRFGVLGLAVGLMSLLTPIVGAGQAFADYAPQPGDVVGVGGDTPQFALDFLANGDYSGAAGYNSAGAYNRLDTFDAVADGNGRAAYAQNSTEASPAPLDPTNVLRAGTFPVQRVSSSGNAITALLADDGSQETINFIGSASLPTSAQQSQASSQGWGYLHVVEIGTDSVQIAVNDETADVGSGNPETNAPSGLSAHELLEIYTGAWTTWAQVAAGGGSASGPVIIPLLPPSSSTIYKTLQTALTTANGGNSFSFSNPNIVDVEQNDPTAITSLGASAVNAIVPFSAARLALWNDGYFHNPTAIDSEASGYTVETPGVSLLTGTAADSSASLDAGITDYIIFRQKDAASTTAFQPGGTENWVQTLFSNPATSGDSNPPAPYVDTPFGQALIAASGVTPDYVDLGDVT